MLGIEISQMNFHTRWLEMDYNMKECFGIIYKATNKINGKVYIGQTTMGLRLRKRYHERYDKTMYFHRAIKKYSTSNFDWDVLEHCCSKEELDEMEFHYIKQFNSTNSEIGYNLTLGGEGSLGFKHSDSTKKLLSEINTGKTLSKKTKIKLSKYFKGKKRPKYVCDKISKARKGVTIRSGYHLSEEHKTKIGVAQKGKKNHMYGKYGSKHHGSKKYIVTTPSGEEIFVHGLAEFCRNNGLNSQLLNACANGKRNYHKEFKCRHFGDNI